MEKNMSRTLLQVSTRLSLSLSLSLANDSYLPVSNVFARTELF